MSMLATLDPPPGARVVTHPVTVMLERLHSADAVLMGVPIEQWEADPISLAEALELADGIAAELADATEAFDRRALMLQAVDQEVAL